MGARRGEIEIVEIGWKRGILVPGRRDLGSKGLRRRAVKRRGMAGVAEKAQVMQVILVAM
jgi:hypothetical protein